MYPTFVSHKATNTSFSVSYVGSPFLEHGVSLCRGWNRRSPDMEAANVLRKQSRKRGDPPVLVFDQGLPP